MHRDPAAELRREFAAETLTQAGRIQKHNGQSGSAQDQASALLQKMAGENFSVRERLAPRQIDREGFTARCIA